MMGRQIECRIELSVKYKFWHSGKTEIFFVKAE
jgi:hypothetical protein